MLRTRLVQGHSDSKMMCDTPSSQDAFTHQIWNSYIKHIGDMHQTQCRFNKLGQGSSHSGPSMVRDTLSSQDACTYQFGIPTSNITRTQIANSRN